MQLQKRQLLHRSCLFLLDCLIETNHLKVNPDLVMQIPLTNYELKNATPFKALLL